nr:ATP-binding protein [uncultured Caproiciproducens sp.]
MRELSLNVMDIVQNSISAGAKLIVIDVCEKSKADSMTIRISDDGAGMTAEQAAHVTDPFFTTRTTRKVGLGIPLFKMEAEMTGGSLEIISEKGVGTTITAKFVPSHVDMIPLGDINSTVLLLITCNEDRNFVFHHSMDSREFTLDTRELRAVLGNGVKLNSPEVIEWTRGFLSEQTQLIKEESTDEVFSGTSGD